MRLEKTILTSLPADQARSLAIAYLERIGYRVLDSGNPAVLKRGSKMGSLAGLKTSQWETQTTLQFGANRTGLTQIDFAADINTTGQIVSGGERLKWALELDQLVQVVDGQELNPHTTTAFVAENNLEKRFRGGVSWFYWIAALSVINAIIWRMDSQMTFVVGLNISQVVDALALDFGRQMPEAATLLSLVALGVNLALAGVFAGLGFLAGRRHRWAYVAGIAMYVLDALVFLIAFDLFSALFHLLALGAMIWGLIALYRLKQPTKNAGQPSVISPA
jgi:hypothetical protein